MPGSIPGEAEGSRVNDGDGEAALKQGILQRGQKRVFGRLVQSVVELDAFGRQAPCIEFVLVHHEDKSLGVAGPLPAVAAMSCSLDGRTYVGCSPLQLMDDDDLSIEKREPGFIASLFGAQPETVLVNKDGDVVGTVEMREPGFFGSLMGEKSESVIVDSDGNDVATFDKDGETTVLKGDDGATLASFEKTDPGFIARLLGDKPERILQGADGERLATILREEPGLLGSLMGEQGKTLIRPDEDKLAELRRLLHRAGVENIEEDRSNSSSSSDWDDDESSDYSLPSVQGRRSINRRPAHERDAIISDEENDDDQRVQRFRSGKVVVQDTSRSGDMINVYIITFKSEAEYESYYGQRCLSSCTDTNGDEVLRLRNGFVLLFARGGGSKVLDGEEEYQRYAAQRTCDVGGR